MVVIHNGYLQPARFSKVKNSGSLLSLVTILREGYNHQADLLSIPTIKA
jgi:hypothetical protein